MESHGRTWLRGKMIGKGGFGSVYLATAKNPKSRNGYFPPVMAVKSAEVSLSGSLQKEKEILQNLCECPNVLRCFGEETTVSEDGNMVYNVLLEYASGGTLARLIKNSSDRVCGLPESEVKRYAKSILGGIFQVHECGYVHCDLKPDNVLLVPSKTTATGSAAKFVAKIGDFGLAKRARRTKKQKLDPYLRGTAMYLAPESVAGYLQEPPSDIWALGCIVLEMLTGNPPWDLNPDYKTEDLLNLIGDQYKLPKIPIGISKEAKDFLKGCFVRNPMFRLTAEMLVDHPFVAGGEGDEDGEVDQEGEDFAETEGVNESSYSSFDSDSSLLSEDWEEGDSDLSSWSLSEDVEEFGSSIEDVTSRGQKRKRVSNFIAIDDGDQLVKTKARAPSKIMHEFTVPTITAGI